MDSIGSSAQLDLDHSFTDQELEAIDAIEAAFVASSSSSSIVKRDSTSQEDQHHQQKDRRKLPDSILYLCKPLASCQDNVKMRYPEIKFGGRILYSRTSFQVEKAARELLRSLKAKQGKTGKVTIGFDIEWKPSFTKGVLPGKVAVMQLCGDSNYCHVMHIIHSGITPSLQSLLEDSTLPKVGVGVGNDSVKLFQDHNVSLKTMEDLSSLANQKLGGGPKSWSLKALTETLVCKELPKPKRIRLGNWEVNSLSMPQLRYAATDAFVSWHLYQVLNSLPDPPAPDAIEAIGAIEAAFVASSSSPSTSSSTVKRNSTSQEDEHHQQKDRRKLPDSIVYLCKPLASSQDNVKMRYPEIKFGGRILYSRTSDQVEKAARKLLRSLKAKQGKTGKVTIGFDIEWKPSFTKGVLPGKVAVMQLCSDSNYCHVMHIIHSGITPSLQSLLEDSTLPKVGVGIGNDSLKLFQDHNVSLKTMEDLSSLANQKLGGCPKNWGLKALTETLVCKELPKPKRIRLGNWEVNSLSMPQLRYAATDAFVSWHLYQVLSSLPDPPPPDAVADKTEELIAVPQ